MLVLNLQRFAGEKTERATPQRRRQARQEGQVARSVELTSAATMLTGIVLLRITAPRVWSSWLSFMNTTFSSAGTVQSFSVGTVVQLARQTGWLFVQLMAPLLAAVMIVGAAVGFAQVGALFLPKLLLPKFSRVNPIEGFKRMFSLRTLVEAVKSVLKLVVVGALAYAATTRTVKQIALLTQTDVSTLAAVIGQIVFGLAIQVGVLFLALAFLDFLFQRFEFEKSIRMSRDDIRQEFRQQEGDPLIRQQVRQRGRQLAMRRMMQDVPTADVVITNPTHFSIALKYDGAKMAAPLVVAKGQDEVAMRIREVARDAGVPLMENRPLARQLYRDVEVGQGVPEALFRAVAEILAAVYRLRDARRRG